MYVKEVIETARIRLQTISPDAKRSMAAHLFAREFQMVSINLGRQAGHTTFIRNQSKPDDLIFCPPGRMHEDVFRFSGGRVTNADRLGRDLAGRRVGDVWIDEPTLALKSIGPEQWDHIMSRMQPTSLIIMLGYLPMPGPR